MDFKVLYIYLIVTILPFFIIHTINGFVNKVYYHSIGGFKFTGKSARFQAILSLAPITLVIVSLFSFADSFRNVNLYLLIALFIIPFFFSKLYLRYLESTYQYYRKPINTRVNWLRALLIGFGIVALIILGFIAFAYLTFEGK